MKSISAWVSLSVFSVVMNFALATWVLVKGWEEQADRYRRIYTSELNDKLHTEIETLSEYLLSGSPDTARQIADAHHDLQQLIEIHSEQIKTPIDDEESLRLKKDEGAWYKEFATPMMETRGRVDDGTATFAQMQMTYLQKDPGNWSGILLQDLKAIRAKLESR